MTADRDSCNKPAGRPCRLGLALTLALLVSMGAAATAHADCENPAGVESEVRYNATHKVMQFCDGDDWIAMQVPGSGAGGGGPVSSSCNISVTTDLVARWPFDESSGEIAHDMVGGYHMSRPAEDGWNPTGGRIDGAIGLGGGYRGSATLGAPLLALDEFTVCFWYDFPSATPSGHLVATNNARWRGISRPSATAVGLWITTSGTSFGAGTDPVYDQDTWNHVCVTYDGSTNGQTGIVFYKNGVTVNQNWGTIGTGDTNASNDGYFIIGGEYTQGMMDDLLVYDRPLSGPEIADIYDDYQSCI